MPTFLYAYERKPDSFGKLAAIVELEDDIGNQSLLDRTLAGRIICEVKKDLLRQFPESKYGVSHTRENSVDFVGCELEDKEHYDFKKMPMSAYLQRVKREPCCPGL